jgi:propionyl-CoA synthetase
LSSSCRCRRAVCRRCGTPTSASSSLSAEFPGYYKTGDAGYIDEDGYLFIMARTDDIINVAGHRLSTGGMEEVLGHPDVAECAVIGIADSMKGQIPRLHRDEFGRRDARRRDREGVVKLVRDKIGPVAAFKTVMAVKRLAQDPLGQDPARDHALHCRRARPWKMPATIDDPAILDEICPRCRWRTRRRYSFPHR